MRPVTFALLAGVLALPAAAQHAPARDAVVRARHAIEHDSAARLEAALDARLRRAPDDSAARLTLATLGQLTYRFDEADRHYDRLIDTTRAPSRWALQAMLGRARLIVLRDAALPPAAVWYRRAAADAHAAGDSATEVEALLGVASAMARTTSDASSDSIYAIANTRLPASQLEVRALFHCARAGPPIQTEEGELAERDEARRGAELAAQAGARRTRAICLLGVAKSAYRDGDLALALAVSDTAAMLQRQARDRAGLAVTLQWRGYALLTTGDYGQAWSALEEAAREASASGADATGSMATMFLASTALRLGDLATAAKYAAVTESSVVRQGNTRAITSLRGIQGDIARAAGDEAAARAAYADALARAGAFGGYPTISPRRALAAMAREAGDWAAAATELDAARAAARQVGLDEWEQRLAYDAAALALERGDLAAAERGFEEYLASLTTEERGRGYPALARLAEIHARRGDIELAAAELVAATDELERWRQSLEPHRQRLLAFQRYDDTVDPDLGVATILSRLALAGQVDRAFALAERRRARDLRDRLMRNDAARRTASTDAETSPALAELTRPMTASAVAASLPDDSTAVVAYVAGRRREPTTAFVITRSGALALELTPVDSLLEPAGRFASLLVSGGPADRAGSVISRAVLEPVIEVLPDAIRRLIVVPDDVLHRVPFDALRMADGRFAIERFTIATVPSASLAVALWKRPAHAGPVTMVAFGDPRFSPANGSGAGDPRRDAFMRTGGGLARLEASGDEARAVSRYAATSQVWLGRHATEHNLKVTPLRHINVLHFATHALVDDRSLTSTALALAPGGGEDGFVSPSDIAALPLSAELVVLSACRTAGGVLVGGEGLQGLASAFLGAGARAVAATSWQIDDETAADMARDYYAALASGLSLGDALRQAKLARLYAGAPPAEWAAWTLVGDPLVELNLREPPSRAGGGSREPHSSSSGSDRGCAFVADVRASAGPYTRRSRTDRTAGPWPPPSAASLQRRLRTRVPNREPLEPRRPLGAIRITSTDPPAVLARREPNAVGEDQRRVAHFRRVADRVASEQFDGVSGRFGHRIPDECAGVRGIHDADRLYDRNRFAAGTHNGIR